MNINYMQRDSSPTSSGPNSSSNSKSSVPNSLGNNSVPWKVPERRSTGSGAGSSSLRQTRRNEDMMDIDGDEDYKDGILGDAHGGLDMCTSTSTSATRGKGKGRTSTARMSSQAQNQSQMGLSQATMTPSASRTRSSQAQTHHRGPSRTHIPPIPVQNNDSAAGRAVVPLPAATGTTFNTTINPNGTVTLTRSTSERQREQGYSQGRPFKQPSSPTSSSSTNSAHMTMTSHAHANMAKGPLTPTSDKSFDHEGGGSGTGPGLDLKTLMSPPTPAPSPTPGRNGWWGTVARDGHEGGVSGGNAGQREDGSFDPSQLLLAFPSLPPPTRLRILEDLLPLLTRNELLMLNVNIGPRLKKDFLKELPVELGLHVLSFIDDPMTLARASLVSKHWYRLLQDEKTWKIMCERVRFQSAQVLPAIPVLVPTRNVPNAAIVASDRSGSGPAAAAIPGSVNTLPPRFGVSTPSQYYATRVTRNTGIPHVGDHEDQDDNEDAEQEEQEQHSTASHAHTGLDYGQATGHASHTSYGYQNTSNQVLGSSSTSRRSNRLISGQEQAMPGAYQTSSTPSTFASNSYDPAAYTGRTNGQLPPMPSIVSPSAVTGSSLQVQQFHLGLGLNQAERRNAPSSNTASPFDSLSYSNRPLSIGQRESDHGDSGAGYEPGGMVASSSSQSGLGRSASVPEPILMQNKRIPSYGTKKPEEIDTDAPGFSYKNHFKKAYLTESNWLRGGRLLSTHTSTDEGVVTTLAMNSKHIIIGMANTKIHLFEAETGQFLRTFSGHELGVWALYLVSSGSPPNDGVNGDEVDMDGDNNFNIGSYRSDLEPAGRGKARKRSRADTRRASLGENSFRGSQSSHTRNGSTSQSSRSNHRTQPGSYDPSGPFGPRYPGVQISGNKWPTSDVSNAAYGWGQKQQFVISGGCDREVKVWDLDTGECLHTLRGHTSTIRCLKVLDGRPVAVTGARDASIRVWDIERGVSLHHLAGHSHSVRCIEIAGHYCVSGSYDCTARLWNLETGECLHVLRGHYHQIYSVAFDGEKVATGSLDSTVRIWSAMTGECVALLQGHTSLVGQLQLSGDILVTGGSDGRVIIFDLSTYTCLQRICAHDNSVTSLQFDDRFILTGGNDGRVKLWDIKTGNFIRELSKPSEAVWRVNFKNDKCAVLCKRAGKTVLELLSFVPEDFSI